MEELPRISILSSLLQIPRTCLPAAAVHPHDLSILCTIPQPSVFDIGTYYFAFLFPLSLFAANVSSNVHIFFSCYLTHRIVSLADDLCRNLLLGTCDNSSNLFSIFMQLRCSLSDSGCRRRRRSEVTSAGQCLYACI